jgi:hypothetical protein
MTRTFGQKNRPIPPSKSVPGATPVAAPSKTLDNAKVYAASAAVVIGMLGLGWAIHDPGFPNHADSITQCEYAVTHQRTGSTIPKSVCKPEFLRATYISGYKIWKRHGYVAIFPYFLEPQIRCELALLHINLATVKLMGRMFAHNTVCANPDEQDRYVELFFQWHKEGRLG